MQWSSAVLKCSGIVAIIYTLSWGWVVSLVCNFFPQDSIPDWSVYKLNGVGPVDNRPSTNLLHHFVKKNKKKTDRTPDTKHVTPDTWHLTCETWHVKPYTLHVTPDMLNMVGVSILSKFQLPSSYGLGIMMFWGFGGKGLLNELMNQWVTKVIVEQPRLHRVC